MINKFRFKFIAITITSIVLLLTTILLVVNIFNYSNSTKFADTTLDYLAEHDGKFDSLFPSTNPHESVNEDQQYFLTQESPFDTRFFTVTFTNGEITNINLNFISLSREEVLDAAVDAYNSNLERGYYDHYYRFLVHTIDDSSKMVLILDNTRLIRPTETLIATSIIVVGSGLGISLVIIFFLSGWVVKPFIESDKKQKRFITDAGHELKTPLTIISANNELIELTNGESEETQTINKQVDRMNDIVRNLTTLAKLNEYDKASFKSFSLTDALYDVSNSFQTTFKKENKDLQMDIKDNITVKADESSVRKIFSILFDNALKYTLTYTKVSLSTEKNKTVFLISNDAKNIKEGNLEKVFDRFYRSEEARGSTIEGSGIGLSIAKELADLNKIKITAFGSAGSVFNIKIVF